MKNVIIFGVSGFAKLAKWYLDNDSDYTVGGFTVDAQYLGERNFEGLPVVPWEEMAVTYPAEDYLLFAPINPASMNQARHRVWQRGLAAGYRFISYISSKATVLSDNIGENCFILEDNTIQPFTKIGSNTVLWSGNHIGHETEIGDNVFVTSQVVISGNCNIGDYSFFGVNSTVRDSIAIAEGTFVAMAAAVTAAIEEPWGAYRGNPAQRSSRPSTDINM